MIKVLVLLDTHREFDIFMTKCYNDETVRNNARFAQAGWRRMELRKPDESMEIRINVADSNNIRGMRPDCVITNNPEAIAYFSPICGVITREFVSEIFDEIRILLGGTTDAEEEN